MVRPLSRAFARATSSSRSIASRFPTRLTRVASCKPCRRGGLRRSSSGAAMLRSSSPSKRISERVHERGPMTVAAFMELALYDAEVGYYARAAQRSGRAGDFFTSVDVGPVFGELLARQVIEMAGLVESAVISQQSSVDLVEA